MLLYFHKLVRSIVKFPKCFIFWPLTIVFIISYPSILQYFSCPGIIQWNDFTIAKVRQLSDLSSVQSSNNNTLMISQVWLLSADSNVLLSEFLNMSFGIQNDYLLQGIEKYSHIDREFSSFKQDEHLLEDDTVYVYSLFSYWNSMSNEKRSLEDEYDNLIPVSKKILTEIPISAENFLGGITRVNGIVLKAKVLKLLFIYRETSNVPSSLIQEKIRQNIVNYISSTLEDRYAQIRLIQDAPGEENLLLRNEIINLKIEKLRFLNKFILCLIIITLLIYASVAFFSMNTFRFKIGFLIAYAAQIFFTFFASISITSYLTKSTNYLEIPAEFLTAPLLFSSSEIMFRLISPTIIKDSICISDKFFQLVIITSIKSGAVVLLEVLIIFLIAFLQNQSQAFRKGVQYCLFVGFSLLINYFLHITFFVCILCIDLVSYEPLEILNANKIRFKYFLRRHSVDNLKTIYPSNEKLSKRLYKKFYLIRENLRHHLLRILLLVKLPRFNNLCYEIAFMIAIVSICLNWSKNGINFSFFSSNYDFRPKTKLEILMNIENFFNSYNMDVLSKYFPIPELGSYNIIFLTPEVVFFSEKDFAVPFAYELEKLLRNSSLYDIYYLMEFFAVLTFVIAALIIAIKFYSKNMQAAIHNSNSFAFLRNPISISAMYNIGVPKSLNNLGFSKPLYDFLYYKPSNVNFNSKSNSASCPFNEKFLSVELESQNQFLDIIKIASNKICPFIVSVTLDRQVLIWSPTVNPLPQPMRLPVPNNLWPITHSIISMHGNFIAVFSRSGVVKIWSRLSMDWIKTVSIPELKNNVPLESFFRRKTVLGNLRGRQKRNSENKIEQESNNKGKKDNKHINSRRSSISSINTNNDYKKVTMTQNLNFLNMTELLLVLKSGKMFTIDCSSSSIKDDGCEAEEDYNKENKDRQNINRLGEEKEGFVITTISKEPLVTSNILISSRVNDRLVSATKDGKIVVATVVNNKWRIRTLLIQENRYNRGKLLMTPLAMQKRQLSILSTSLLSPSKATSSILDSTSSPTSIKFPASDLGCKANNEHSRRSSISSTGSMTNTMIPKRVVAEDLLNSVIVPVAFVGMIVRTRGLIADLIDVQTGTLVKQFHIAQFRTETFRVFHDQPTHCKFCGCASISSFSIAYTELESDMLILHTFSNEGRAKNSICLRVERDPRETRCLGFDAVNEQHHWLANVEVWNLTDLNMIEGVIRKETETQTGNKSSAFENYSNDFISGSVLSAEKNNSKLHEYKISKFWKGFTMSATGVVNYHEIPDNDSHGLIIKKLKLTARFGHKAIIVPFGNIMKVLYLGNDELIITSNLDEDGNSNQKLSGLSFVSKRRMRHIELINSKNFTELPAIEQ